MPAHHSTATLLIGAVSAASGALLCVAPQPLASLFGLPRNTTLLRLLGVRDIFVGCAMLSRDSQTVRLGICARALSDAMDAGLIAAQASRGEQPLSNLAFRVPAALALSRLTYSQLQTS